MSVTSDSLTASIRRHGPLIVAFSGGVDSALLLAAAVRALGRDGVFAAHACSAFVSHHETELAEAVARQVGVTLHTVPYRPLDVAAVSSNLPERCYHCKRLLYAALLECARPSGFRTLADGANLDDAGDFRPGARAAAELGVVHPFLEAGFGKTAIRELAHAWGLPNWDAPAAACLASRIPCGTPITLDALRRIEVAEEGFRRLGFSGHRVRHYGTLAKIELPPEQMARALTERARLLETCRAAGFREAALDLAGYRRSPKPDPPGPGQDSTSKS